MSGFNWPALMRAGFVGLRLHPAQFWDLTPAELQLMLGAGAAAPMRRAGLDALMQAFPDDTPSRGAPDDEGDTV